MKTTKRHADTTIEQIIYKDSYIAGSAKNRKVFQNMPFLELRGKLENTYDVDLACMSAEADSGLVTIYEKRKKWFDEGLCDLCGEEIPKKCDSCGIEKTHSCNNK